MELVAVRDGNEDDLCRIISKGPWSIMGSILILRKWDQAKSFSDLDFSPFWVQIHSLPLGFLNSKTGMVVAKSLGEVIAVEEPGDRGRMTNFLRARVWLDISKPFKKGFFLRRSKEEDLWVRFKYERLSDFCYGCGKEFDGSLRAEFVVVDTIQYGNRPLLRLIYPEGRQSVGEDGGACSGTGKERVAISSGNIPSPDPEVRQNRGIVERIVVRTNPLESDTFRAGINEVEDLSSGTPSVIQQIDCESAGLKCGFVGPSIGLSSGGEEVCDGPLYYVEEPDSPRPKFGVGRAKNPVEIQVGPTSFLGNSLSVDLDKVGQCPRTVEEGLVSAFNKALNLKRKGVEEPERDQGKRLKGSGSVEAGEQELALVHLSAGGKGSPRSPHRGCLGRGRGRRGGRAGKSTIRGWNPIPILCDVDLVDVEVRAGSDSGVSASKGSFGPESATAGAIVQIDERALVAGLE
ncbi:hypothetical protein RHGRI_017305 [Rhododendron griersonianum]|uniref:Zinc knuckle CX2CX4HX4C domain-containing protein n=1 Tax=Rhododendron griersonianum TaxID=479676 RepID=A0AAV6JXD4_9ERIC|nr:hypothetical protein RHGRI_017305 [Rhododendron griersonianum]